MHLQAWHIRAGVRAGSRGGGSARCVPAFPLGVVFFFYVLPTQTKITLFKKGWWGGIALEHKNVFMVRTAFHSLTGLL